MKRRIAVRAVIVQDGKLLCAQLKPYHESVSQNDYWSTPGGGIDEGEALVPALQREIMEELGVQAVVGNLLYVQQFEYWGHEHLEFFFHVANAQDFIGIDLSKTTHGALEIERLDFVDPANVHIRPVFLKEEDVAAHIASNAPVRFFNYLSGAAANS